MDGENNAQMEQQQVEGQMDQQPTNLNNTEAALAQEEAFLEAQAASLAEVKRRRKE